MLKLPVSIYSYSICIMFSRLLPLFSITSINFQICYRLFVSIDSLILYIIALFSYLKCYLIFLLYFTQVFLLYCYYPKSTFLYVLPYQRLCILVYEFLGFTDDSSFLILVLSDILNKYNIFKDSCI